MRTSGSRLGRDPRVAAQKKILPAARPAKPPIVQLVVLKSRESPESGPWTIDSRPIAENPIARITRLTPAEIF